MIPIRPATTRLLTMLCLLLPLPGWTQAPATGEIPRLVVQTGHGQFVNSLAFSPDGRLIASASDDKTAKLWDVASERELLTFAGHEKSVVALAFSPDGRQLATASADKTIRLWDLANGKAGPILNGHTAGVNSVLYLPDGRTLVSAGADQTIRWWDLASGKALRAASGHAGKITVLARSADGKFLVSGSADNTLKLWDAATGSEIRSFAGHRGSVLGAAISPDSRLLASGSGDNSIKVWDLASGRELRTLSGHQGNVESLLFLPDGRTLVSGGWDKTLRTWDVDSGQSLAVHPGAAGALLAMALSPDGQTLAYGGTEYTVALRDVKRQADIGMLKEKGSAVTSIALSRDAQTLAAGNLDHSIQLWDTTARRSPRRLSGHTERVVSVSLSPDGRTLASASWDQSIRLWDVDSGSMLRSLNGHGDRVLHVVHSPDGKLLASTSADGTIKLWDSASGREIRTLAGHQGWVLNAAFSPDGQTLFTSGWDRSIKRWQVATGKLQQSLNGHEGWILASALSPDGRLLASGGRDKQIRLWDSASGKLLKHWTAHAEDVTSLAFAADGKSLLSGASDNQLITWDLASGQPVRQFTGHGSSITGALFVPGGDLLLSSSYDMTTRVWDGRSGRTLATITSFRGGDWAVTEPGGRFDAANGGDTRNLHWVVGATPVDLAQLKAGYYDPGLLGKILGFQNEPLRPVPQFDRAVQRRWPAIDAAIDAQNPLQLNIRLSDRGDGLGQVRVRLNGKEILRQALTAGADGTARLSLPLDPERLADDNLIDIAAWPGDGPISSPPVTLRLPGKTQRGASAAALAKPVAETPRLFGVVMGVSQYADPGLRLAFSGKDAADFARAATLGGGRLFGTEHTRIRYFSDYREGDETIPADRQPTRENLQQALADIAREARAGDLLVVYLAGHGVMSASAGGEADYVYLTRDARNDEINDPARRRAWGVSSSELAEWIKAVKANKQVLILDTCAAGGAIDKLAVKRQIPGAQVIALEQLKDRAGVHILAGAAADRVSYEATRYGQGLLTYALLAGVKGAALKDGIVDVQTLFQYTRDEVPRLARQIGGIQEPRLSAPQGESFAIGRMTEEERQRVPLSRIKPVVQRTSFQDDARGKDVLRLSQRINERLRGESLVAARSGMVYVDTDDFPDAWQVTGRYTRRDNGLQIRLWLYQGDTEKATQELLLPLDETAQTDALLGAIRSQMEKLAAAGKRD